MSMTKSFFQGSSFRICVSSIGVIFLLSACSDSDDPAVAELVPANDDSVPGLLITGLEGDVANTAVSPWLANINLFRLASQAAGGGDASVDLLQYDADFPVSRHVDFYTETLDTCEIRTDDGGGGVDNNPPLSVSGGNTVTINSPSGTFVEINRGGDDEGFYETNDGMPGELPMGATLSIPGALFPNVPAYPLSEPVAPVRIAPAAGTLTLADASLPFIWEALPPVPGGYMELVALAFDGNGEFQGFPVVCKVIDDGEFTLPADVIEEFASSTLDIQTRFDRVIERVDFINGIVFHQRSVITD